METYPYCLPSKPFKYFDKKNYIKLLTIKDFLFNLYYYY